MRRRSEYSHCKQNTQFTISFRFISLPFFPFFSQPHPTPNNLLSSFTSCLPFISLSPSLPFHSCRYPLLAFLISAFQLKTYPTAILSARSCLFAGLLALTCCRRLFDRTGRLDEALACLRAFVARYPPSDVREPSSTLTQQADMRSTRVSLAGSNRPLVRLTTALDVHDDDVPPLLTFSDTETLHHRLVAASNRHGIAYVKWVCKAYEGALRKRREATLQV